MRAAIYARYSSENQRPESIEDQVEACTQLARSREYVIDQSRIYTDAATSGARRDRVGLAELLSAANEKAFEVVLIDDLSRLARSAFLLLSILEELRFMGVKVLAVADGLDSDDEEASLGIQVRGIFNELQLADLRKKTLRGQIGQKRRGFTVGEATFGYRSIPVGTFRTDKKGRPRPDGYRMRIEPREAGVVLRVFENFASGISECRIARQLNEESVPGRRCSKGWSASTIHRMLRNEKYVGRWIWNRRQTRRDPRTGRRRQFQKPESDWFVSVDESLRIVPAMLWDAVLKRAIEVRKVWPGRGFSRQQASCVTVYPRELLSGLMTCGVCGGRISKLSGKAGGYLGCASARRGKCANRLLVRRTLAEAVILAEVRARSATATTLSTVLEQMDSEFARETRTPLALLPLKEAELRSEERRVANFLEFVGSGHGSVALMGALRDAERRRDALKVQVQALRRDVRVKREGKPGETATERLDAFLARRTEASALLLRGLVGAIRLDPFKPKKGGKLCYRAVCDLFAVPLLPPVRFKRPRATMCS
jgi:DNA invertase Pin-like site-specific DNA recombinase